MLVRDDTTQATVLTDRAQGASSPADGVLDIMVRSVGNVDCQLLYCVYQIDVFQLHRRSFYDDHWGVEEPLNEPGEGVIRKGRLVEFWIDDFSQLCVCLAGTDGRGLIVTGKHVVQVGPVKVRDLRSKNKVALPSPKLCETATTQYLP